MLTVVTGAGTSQARTIDYEPADDAAFPADLVLSELRLVDLQRPITASLNRNLIGRTVPVMVEGDSKRSLDQWMGRTDTNITVIWNKSDAPASLGSMQPITILDANAAVLMGRLDSLAAQP